ncbi:ornithine cyclodeaminase [Virgibacillus subterraneus]|uniref:Ornithine cyclodeaminase n=1 Tax=Virgibacillus subterraneus TaxID=621109 RepID=A0A1H9B5F8_9BACI|nr:ornithine cyclodeaminase family protein [Virgibacillus subterraneus]SEP83478.1 ornithine cyclodeaminase [Virgibacillus subterraneus]
MLSSKEINKAISMREVISSIEDYYLQDKSSNEITPDRMHIDDEDNTALLMPAFYGDYYSTKLVGVAPNNTKLDKPTIHGLMVLYNRKTLEPLMTFDAMPITALRTGALGGLGMKYLSDQHASSIGIIGTGTQGWSHLQSACAVRTIDTVYVYNRSSKKLNDFISKAEKEFPDLTVQEAGLAELIINSDIVITTTTSKTPVLPNMEPSVWKGKLVVAVGSFKTSMQELPDSFLSAVDEFYVDASSAFHESGDMIRAKQFGANESSTMSLEKMIKERHRPNDISDKTLLFKSVGIGIFDLITAKVIYEKNS